MLEIKAQIKGGEIFYGGDLSTYRAKELLKKNEGSGIIITLDDRESWEKRKFFEGAVTQYFYYQHPFSGWTDFRQAREVLKIEYNGEWINDEEGKQIRIARSSKMSNGKFVEFLGRIQDDFQEQGLLWPDSEDYLKWQETAPDTDQIYPPLKLLIKKYQQEKENPKPVWRR